MTDDIQKFEEHQTC